MCANSLGKASLYFKLNVMEGCGSGAGSWRERLATNRIVKSESGAGGRQGEGLSSGCSTLASFPGLPEALSHTEWVMEEGNSIFFSQVGS